MLDNITIIIITHKRHLYLRRLLKFYNSYNLQCKFLVLDSTPENPKDPELKKLLSMENVQWKKYDHDIFLVDKIANGCSFINSRYAVICADDDFLIPSGIAQCIEFLADNPDYSSAHGLYFHHTIMDKARKTDFKFNFSYKEWKSLKNNTGAERFLHCYVHRKAHSMPFYAVYRTNLMQFIWEEANEYVESLAYAELFPCAMSFIYGKNKILPIFYSSREQNNMPFYFESNEVLYREMHSKDKTDKILKGLTKHLSLVDGISRFEAASIINKFDPIPESLRPGYTGESEKKRTDRNDIPTNSNRLTNHGMRNNAHISLIAKLKNKVRLRTRMRNYFRQGCPDSIYPRYLKDFKKVKKAVLSAGLLAENLNISRQQKMTFKK